MSTPKSLLKLTTNTDGLTLSELLHLLYFSNNYGDSQALAVISLISKDTSCLDFSIYENEEKNQFEITFVFDNTNALEKYAGFLI